MKKFRVLSFIFLIVLPVIIIGFYSAYLFILPPVLNSVKMNTAVEKFIYKKTGLELTLNKLNIKTYKNLSFSFHSDEISLKKEKNKVFDANDINIKIFPFNKELSEVSINNIYLDKAGLNNLFTKQNKENNKKIRLDLIPQIKVLKAIIEIKDDHNNHSLIDIDNFILRYDRKEKHNTTLFDAKIQSTRLKNLITINNRNNIKFDSENIKIENLKINIYNTHIFINGIINPKENKKDLHFTGKDIPVNDIQSSALYYLKLKNQKKNFMENFTDYSGSADINLKVNNNGINGKVFVKHLGGKTVLFEVPVKFQNFTGYFYGDKIKAEAYGTLGQEKVFTNFYLSHYDKERRRIHGSVHSIITNKTMEQYMPEFKIEGNIDATVGYTIEKSVPKVTYTVKLAEGSNLEYKHLSLGLVDKKRRLVVKTKKYPGKLYITSYDYYVQDGEQTNKIITGDGLFENINNKMRPSYVTIKTLSPAPVSVTGSFGERLEGGTFYGDLKYDFIKSLLTGKFNLSNSKFKDFYIEKAAINADENIAVISSEGTYLNSPYSCYINMDNKYTDLIKVHTVNLFLNKYVIKTKKHKQKQKRTIKIPKQVKELNYIVEEGSIRLNELIHERFLIQNIIINGDLNNNIVTFRTKDARFAKGNLRAKGSYNIHNKNADIDFSADNIDSNSVAAMMFNLPGEIKGTAKASLKAKINTETHDVNANAEFEIKEGYLPKIGSTEFIIKGSDKYNKKPLRIRLSDIINIDISKAKAMASDINGSFEIDNKDLENIRLFSKQKYLSLFVEGEYDIDTECANIKLWGKYNKTARNKVRIMFVPLSFIMKIIFKEEQTKHLYKNKIEQIPRINAKPDEAEYFRVKMNGNLNNNDIKIELKSIK